MKPGRSRICILAAGCLFWAVGVQTASAADPALTVQRSTGIAGGNAVIVIQLSTGTDDVSAWALDLTLPSALTPISVAAGAAALAAGKAADGNQISPGVYRVLVIGLNATPIGSGPCALVTVQIANGTPPGDLSVGVGNLQMSDPAGNPVTGSGVGGAVTVLTGGAISIFWVSAGNVTATDALITWNTDVPGDSQVEYGLTAAYGQSTALDGTPVSEHSQAITGLAATTVYHFRVRSNAAVSGDYVFSTAGGAPPNFSVIAASVLGASSATVTWNTDIPADSQVIYGTTTAYGLATAPDPTLSLTHAQTLVGLSSATLYHFSVQSQDAAGNTSVSGDFTFTTDAAIVQTSSPIISNVQVSNITSLTAEVTWTTDQPSNSVVTYGSAGSSFLITPDNSTFSTSHSVPLSNLTPASAYDFWVISRNASNLISASTPATFTTAAAGSSDYPTLTIGSGAGVLGGTIDIDVHFSPGLQPMKSLEFDLGLQSWISGGPTLTGPVAAAANMTASGAQVAAGQYRIQISGLFTSLSQSGSVATVRLALGSSGFGGTFSIPVIRTQLYDQNNNLVAPNTVAGTLSVTGGSSIRVWPNPWRSDLHGSHPVRFGNLSFGSEIRIFTTSGYWVRTLRNTINTQEWDLKNEDGSRVASGLYYYLITSPNNPKTTGEVVVIR